MLHPQDSNTFDQIIFKLNPEILHRRLSGFLGSNLLLNITEVPNLVILGVEHIILIYLEPMF